MDRRDAIDLPQPADTGDAVADLLADRDALAEAMAPAPDPEEWGRLAAEHEESGGDTDERQAIT